ncbi:hypothetical protein HY251_06190 [bacterium]|nr:hypothetical protein [bacterium]
MPAFERDPLARALPQLGERGNQTRRADREPEPRGEDGHDRSLRERTGRHEERVEDRERDSQGGDLEMSSEDRGPEREGGEPDPPSPARERELDSQEGPRDPARRDRPEVELEPRGELPREPVHDRSRERGVGALPARSQEQERSREREREVTKDERGVRGPRGE